MSHDTRWGAWAPDEEMLYFEFAEFHVDGTPWPIEEMDLAACTRNLNCRPFTQHVLELKVLLEWKMEQAEKVKGKGKEREIVMEEETKRDEEKRTPEMEREDESKRGGYTEIFGDAKKKIPKIHITAPSARPYNSMPPALQQDTIHSVDSLTHGLTPSEWSIYIEFANTQRLHTNWPVELMDNRARERGLVCRPFTQEMLNAEFKNHPRYLPPRPMGVSAKKPNRKVLTLAEARQKSTVEE